MDYDKQSLTITNVDGSISRLTNGGANEVLIGAGANSLPAWKTLAQADIAQASLYLPLTGGTLTGSLSGTAASFSGAVSATGGFTGDLTGTASNASKVANKLSIQLGSNTASEYNGSAAVTIQVTPSAIGAAASTHYHAYTDITSGWPNEAGLLYHDTTSTTTRPIIMSNPTLDTNAGLYFPAQSVGVSARSFVFMSS